MDRITTLDLRARLGELLDRVRLRFDSFVVERRGREVAAIVPAERLRRVEEFARRRAEELEAMQDSHARVAGYRPAEVKRAVGEAVRGVRSARKARRR